MNAFIVYKLNILLANPDNNFTTKNYLFGAVKLKRNASKISFLYNGNEIGFNGSAVLNLTNGEFAQNVMIFGIKIKNQKSQKMLKEN